MVSVRRVLGMTGAVRSLSSSSSSSPRGGVSRAVLHLSRVESGLAAAWEETEEAVAADLLAGFFRRHGQVVALTGAGVSTASGIPDYRGAEGSYRRGHRPMGNDDFLADDRNRARYWARALVGYDAFSAAEPNSAHAALAALERRGKVSTLITQNVDGLHQKAGSRAVVDLHGRGDQVRCIACGAVSDRADYHATLREANADLLDGISKQASSARAIIRPDGDAEVETEADVLDRFEVCGCQRCGGVLKPDVVFFGDSVPAPRVKACLDAVRSADALICVGSSLAVYSAFRFVRLAHQEDKPICVLNLGRTRAEIEDLPILKIGADAQTLHAALDKFE